MSPGATNDPRVVAAVALAPAGAKVGLGSGRAASAFIIPLATRPGQP